MKFSVETITPEIASEYLGKSAGNRPLKRQKVYAYGRDMANGRWVANGEPIIFNKSGNLVDGHNRLTACKYADATFQSVVIREAPDEAQKTYDMGASRTIGDAVSFCGYKHANAMTSVALAVESIKNGRPRSANLSSSEVLEFIEANPEVEQAGAVAGSKLLPRVGAIIGALWFISRKIGEEENFDQFLEVLAQGIPAYHGCPAHAFRDRILRDMARRERMSLADVHRLAVYAWGKFRRGEKVIKLTTSSQYKVDGFHED